MKTAFALTALKIALLVLVTGTAVVGCSSAPLSSEEAKLLNQRMEDKISRLADYPHQGQPLRH